jgi:hypothetical protein
MAPDAVTGRKIPVSVFVAGTVAVIALIGALVYLNKPAAKTVDNGSATAEAKAYLRYLALSDVKMQATENFMQQQVVEVVGNISNNGPRKLALVDVYCFFKGVDGSLVYRERVSMVRSGGGVSALGSGETRAFRLPFDQIPTGWNQAAPALAIAEIKFAE